MDGTGSNATFGYLPPSKVAEQVIMHHFNLLVHQSTIHHLNHFPVQIVVLLRLFFWQCGAVLFVLILAFINDQNVWSDEVPDTMPLLINLCIIALKANF